MSWPSPFDDGVGFVVTTPEDLTDYQLHPEELALLNPAAIESRRESFALGRAAAARALAALKLRATPVLRGEREQPLWPEGVVGSIAHTCRFGVAAVARRTVSGGLGVDLEAVDRPLNHDISRRICQPQEQSWIDADENRRHERLIRMFSAKEAIYKAFYPIDCVFFGFLDVTLTPSAGGFAGILHKTVAPDYPAGATFEVRSTVVAGMVLSAIQLPPG